MLRKYCARLGDNGRCRGNSFGRIWHEPTGQYRTARRTWQGVYPYREKVKAMKTVVIGGGVIGLLSAYELAKRGRDVVVIDKGRFGMGASLGNAGWVTPSLSGPVPAPGIVGESIKWMLRPDSPLYVKPTAVPAMLGWLLSFWRYCNTQSYQAGFQATADLNQRTMADFDALKDEGFEFEMYEKGLLFVGLSDKAIERMMVDFRDLAKHGFGEPIQFTKAETLDREPALKDGIAGSVLMPQERHVRPEQLNEAALKWLRQNEVTLMEDVEVFGFQHQGGKVSAVETTRGVIEADEVLLATGAEVGQLAKYLGVRIPMQAGKGYSITVTGPALKLQGPMYMFEDRIAVSPFENNLRIAGTMELSGVNKKFDKRRVAAIRTGAHRFLKNWEEGEAVHEWVGMRPMVPDGIPVIGALPRFSNAFIASGHAMLGTTLGPTTAAIIAEVMVEGKTASNLAPFSPARFS